MLSYNGTIHTILVKIYKLLKINLLILLFSLPLFTLFKSFSTGYEMIINMESIDITIYEFFRRFRKNFFEIAIVQCLTVVAIALLSIGIFNIKQPAIQFTLLILLSLVLIYVYTLLISVAYYTLEHRHIYLLSGYLAFRYTLLNGIGISIILFSFLIPIFLPRLFFIWLFFCISLPLYCQLKLYDIIQLMYNRSKDNENIQNTW